MLDTTGRRGREGFLSFRRWATWVFLRGGARGLASGLPVTLVEASDLQMHREHDCFQVGRSLCMSALQIYQMANEILIWLVNGRKQRHNLVFFLLI